MNAKALVGLLNTAPVVMHQRQTMSKKKPGPKPKHGEKCVRKSISIPDGWWAFAEARADKLGISVSEYVSRLIRKAMRERINHD